MNFKLIFEGWRNKLFPPEEIKETVERVSKERLEHCNNCLYNSKRAMEIGNYKSIRIDEHCIHCGCTLSAKIACLSCSCPINKWSALLSSEEDNEIELALKNTNGTGETNS